MISDPTPGRCRVSEIPIHCSSKYFEGSHRRYSIPTISTHAHHTNLTKASRKNSPTTYLQKPFLNLKVFMSDSVEHLTVRHSKATTHPKMKLALHPKSPSWLPSFQEPSSGSDIRFLSLPTKKEGDTSSSFSSTENTLSLGAAGRKTSGRVGSPLVFPMLMASS